MFFKEGIVGKGKGDTLCIHMCAREGKRSKKGIKRERGGKIGTKKRKGKGKEGKREK